MMKLCFSIFDFDGDRFISENDLFCVLSVVNDEAVYTNVFAPDICTLSRYLIRKIELSRLAPPPKKKE
jgi:hypothetical protein